MMLGWSWLPRWSVDLLVTGPVEGAEYLNRYFSPACLDQVRSRIQRLCESYGYPYDRGRIAMVRKASAGHIHDSRERGYRKKLCPALPLCKSTYLRPFGPSFNRWSNTLTP